MTLEEGIVHAEDVARMNHEAAKHLTDEHPTQAEKCEVCAEEHRQLAEWLKELKVYKYNESNGGLVEALMHSEAENERLHDELKAYRANTCDDAVSRAIVQEEITKSIELKENPYQLWYRIRALPSVTPQPCDDAISRQEAKRAIEALEQEPKAEVLDKIRERVELEKLGYPPSAGYYRAIMKVLQIIDKYKAESEVQE